MLEYFKQHEYKKKRTTLAISYVQNIVSYIKTMNPNMSEDLIKTFVTNYIKENMQRPTIEIIDHPSYGNAELKTVDLYDHVRKHQYKLITPCGTIYQTPDIKESFLKVKINKNLAKRKKLKNEMLRAGEIGDEITASKANYGQSQVKINTNAIPGAHGSEFNCLSDVANYNGVTSTARHGVMCGYAHTEKFISGNFYFPDIEHIINYCICLKRIFNREQVENVVNKFNLYIPTVKDIVDHFLQSTQFYIRKEFIESDIYDLISKFDNMERCFIFYASCLKNIVMFNTEFFLPYLDKFFDRDNLIIDNDVNIKKINDFKGDLKNVITSLNSDLIDNLPLEDAIKDNHPNVRNLITIGDRMLNHTDEIQDIISTFITIDMDVADAMGHPNMIRRCVIASDTDSVIFTVQDWVKWYTGHYLQFSKKAFNINAFVVFMLSMSIEHLFARLSTSFGIVGKDAERIIMKNEFLYPIMLNTPLPKHYIGLITIQEGKILAKIKLDIKGLTLRSSAHCLETRTSTNKFIDYVLDGATKTGSLSAEETFMFVYEHEQTVYKSLLNGDKTFLTVTPINEKEQYTDPLVSKYFYYLFWSEVFAEEYGEFLLPSKGHVVHLLNKGKSIKSEAYLNYLKEKNEKLYIKLVNFFDKYPNKNISFIIFPSSIKKIPEIFIPLINYRRIVFDNSTPHYLIIRSLGIPFGDSKVGTIISDIYGQDLIAGTVSGKKTEDDSMLEDEDITKLLEDVEAEDNVNDTESGGTEDDDEE